MNKTIKPQKLKKGDKIGFLSVSGVIKDIDGLNIAKENFEKLGYKVKISDTSFSEKNYFCDDDEKRVKALNEFFADEEIKAIICTRGGYGAIRLIDNIDYELIKKNPKIFCGYSDISALLWMIYKKTGLITFHGAHAISTFKENGFTQQFFWKLMKNDIKKYSVENLKVYNKGCAQGVLLGGNLCTISSLCGSDFLIDEDFILFLEDINEPVYKIDRMFMQLYRTKDFTKHLKGIAIGGFGAIDDKKAFDDFWYEIAEKLNIPVCSEFKISHENEHVVIPYGVKVSFNAKNGEIEILESYL